MSREFIRVIVPDSHGAHIDKAAAQACLRDIKALDPEEIVGLGDHLDCGGTFSEHQRNYTNEMTESYEDDIKACNWFFDGWSKAAPRAKVYVLEGNHEAHVERWAARNFQSQKDAVGFLERYGPQSVLKFKERGWRYFLRSEMYMGLAVPGVIRLGKCFYVHGMNHSKHAAATHLSQVGANVVFGHVHRVQSVSERTVTSAGYGAWCPGTLAKLQPLYRHTTPTSWSHGYAVQFVSSSGRFLHVNVPIHKGQSLLPKLLKAA